MMYWLTGLLLACFLQNVVTLISDPVDDCLMELVSCQVNENKDIYTTEPSDEDIKANKDDICTINKSFKDCLVAADCNNAQVDMELAKSTQIADKCDEYHKEKEDGETPTVPTVSTQASNGSTGITSLDGIYINTSSGFNVNAGITKDLSLNCTLPGDQLSANIMSMILYKTDDLESDKFRRIAAITMKDQTVEVKDDLGGGQVKGHLEHVGGTSFISYQWDYPGSQVTGRYQCTAHGMNDLGYPVNGTAEAAVEIPDECLEIVNMDEILNKLKNYTEKIDRIKTPIFLTHMGAIYKNHFYFITIRFGSEVHKMQQQCQEKGGYLVEIDDEEEYKFLKAYLTGLSVDYSYFHIYKYYIGITSKGHPDRWTYMSSDANVTFNKWADGYPGSDNSECAYWNDPHINDGWVTFFCEQESELEYMGICEVEF